MKSRRPSSTDGIVNLGHPKTVRPKKSITYIFVGVAAVVVLVVVILTHFVSGSVSDQNKLDVVKNEVSKHIVLPSNEEPALLTVTDPTKLTTPFLKQTLIGDKILVYKNNKKAIVYRPSIDRIIDVGPVSIDTPPSKLTQ